MKNLNPNKTMIARRAFLKGSAGAVGLSILSLSPAAALAKALAAPAGKGIVLAYWNGERFVRADRLPAGDASLQDLRVNLRSFGSKGTIKALDFHTVVAMAAGEQPVAFHVWEAPPRGSGRAKFVHHVDSEQGLLLTIFQMAGTQEVSVPVQLVAGSGAGAKLREGVYVLADANVDFGAYAYDAKHPEAPLQKIVGLGAPGQYLLIKLERA